MKRNLGFTLIELLVFLAVIGMAGAIAGGIAFRGDSPDAALRRVLEQAGYSQVQPTGYRFFGCADNDLFRQGFKALGPTGQPVSGVVCSAPLKGHTIRLD